MLTSFLSIYFFHSCVVIATLKLQLGTHGSNLTEEELETHTIAAWKEGKAHISRQYDGTGRPYPRPLVQVRLSQLLSTAIISCIFKISLEYLFFFSLRMVQLIISI